MSPLVQRPRTNEIEGQAGSDEHWSMLVFEGLSVGTMVVLMVMLAMMVVVGVYVIVVWPLTLWDLADLRLDKYGRWVKAALWSLFAGGSLAGYWCVTGAAFKRKSVQRGPSASTRGGKSTRR